MPYSLCRTMLFSKTKPDVRRMVAAEHGGAGLERRVVTDGDVARAVEQLEEPPGPQRPPTSTNRLLRIAMRRVCWLGWLSSRPRMLMPAPACRTTLLAKVTSSTTDQGAPPSWLRTVNRIAKPFCACGQLCSNRLPSTSTRRAFFSSKRFFTVHAVPSNAGCSLLQRSGLAKWLRVDSMSAGTRSWIDGSAPPNMTFSPAASR